MTLKVMFEVKFKVTVEFLVENYSGKDLDLRENSLNWGNFKVDTWIEFKCPCDPQGQILPMT